MIIGIIIYVAIIVGLIASIWKVFEKAGQPGWACLVPIYNTYIMIKIAGRPDWWIIFALIFPLPLLILPFDIAKKFGKGGGFGAGLLFLGIIFWPMLGFGDAQYIGAGGEENSSTEA